MGDDWIGVVRGVLRVCVVFLRVCGFCGRRQKVEEKFWRRWGEGGEELETVSFEETQKRVT